MSQMKDVDMGTLLAYHGVHGMNRRGAHRAVCIIVWCLLTMCCPAASGQAQNADRPYVCVSSRDPRYFELSDGRAYIPIGLNMIAPPGGDEKKALAQMEDWMSKLSANGGNYIRLWLSHWASVN